MSGRKNNLKQYNSIANGDMSGSLISAVTDIQFLDDIGIQLNFTGSPVGTFSVQVSSNHFNATTLQPLVAGTWASIPVTYWDGAAFVTSTTIPTSVGSPIILDLNQLGSTYLRVIYTRASGTGSLTAVVTGKGV